MKQEDKVLPILWSLLRIGILIAIVLLIKLFLIDVYPVGSPWMEPTLGQKGIIVATKYDRIFAHGKIVVFDRKGRENDMLVGRVTAVEGDTIKIEGGQFYLNGEVAEEPYLEPGTLTDLDENWFIKEGVEVTVPDDSYFIMGDNREGSVDSRQFGFVPKENVKASFLRCALNC